MNISAVLLAGGESRRMGQDKATLLFREKPLWQTQLELLRHLDPAELFVSARTDPTWRPPGVQFVADNAPSRGALSGLSASLARTRTRHLLALAIDMPFMTENYLRSLCCQLEPGHGVVPMIGDRTEPLVAIYPVEARADLLAALSGADFSLQSVIRKLVSAGTSQLVHVSTDQETFFRNLNEPADLSHDR